MTLSTNNYHTPVLLSQSIEGLNIKPDGVYVDLTFGGGGHSREILKHLSPNGRLFGFDKDRDSAQNIIDDERFCLINEDYCLLTQELRLFRVFSVDGILADLGISSHQIDTTQRGFSFRNDANLDLRMDNRQAFTAADIVNNYSQKELADLFFAFGQLSMSKQIAKNICLSRQDKPIITTLDLCHSIEKLSPENMRNKFFAKVFQALRIETNHELDSLQKMLDQLVNILSPKGRLAIITYHSLEDKLVKNLISTGNASGKVEKDFYGNTFAPFKKINSSPIVADQNEITLNPRSRSAKLRIAEKK